MSEPYVEVTGLLGLACRVQTTKERSDVHLNHQEDGEGRVWPDQSVCLIAVCDYVRSNLSLDYKVSMCQGQISCLHRGCFGKGPLACQSQPMLCICFRLDFTWLVDFDVAKTDKLIRLFSCLRGLICTIVPKSGGSDLQDVGTDRIAAWLCSCEAYFKAFVVHVTSQTMQTAMASKAVEGSGLGCCVTGRGGMCQWYIP